MTRFAIPAAEPGIIPSRRRQLVRASDAVLERLEQLNLVDWDSPVPPDLAVEIATLQMEAGWPVNVPATSRLAQWAVLDLQDAWVHDSIHDDEEEEPAPPPADDGELDVRGMREWARRARWLCVEWERAARAAREHPSVEAVRAMEAAWRAYYEAERRLRGRREIA